MYKNNPIKAKIPLREKATLVIFGLFLFLILLETGLRLCGFIILSLQEHRNLQTIKQKGNYRIMCLGESTTQNAYPIFLEQILNQRNIGIKFSVIDKGVGGINSSGILARLEFDLDKYHPDMVVTMMGINDCGRHMPYEPATSSKVLLFFRSFKIYRLARLIYLHTVTQARKTNAILDNKSAKEDVVSTSQNNADDLELVLGYLRQNKFSQAKELLEKIIESCNFPDSAFVKLGVFYRDRSKFLLLEDIFKKLISLCPKDNRAYVRIGWFYQDQGRFPEAEYLYNKAIELNPENDQAYGAVAMLYTELGNFELAEEYEIRAKKLRVSYYDPITVKNYYKVKDILDRRGIPLVCVQYPLRDIISLKKIFEGKGGIVFVDNEALFKNAIKKEGFKEYFFDRFAGDFGHCTPKGNRLLAENIANVILNKVFRRKIK